MPLVFALEGPPCAGKSTVLGRIAEMDRARLAAGEAPRIVVVPEPVETWAEALRGVDSGEAGARLALQALAVQHYTRVAADIAELDPTARVVLERSPRATKVFALLHKQYDPTRAAAYDFVLSGLPDLDIAGYFELVVPPEAAAQRASERQQCGDNGWTADALRAYGAVFEAVFDGVPRTPLSGADTDATAESIVAAVLRTA